VSDKLPTNGGYVAAAYLIFLGLLLVYFAVMATRAARLERELSEVNRLVEEAAEGTAADPAAPDAEPVNAGGES